MTTTEHLHDQIARLSAELAALKQATGGITILPPDEVPAYEVAGDAYVSPDNIYYPVGARFEDITGSIIPNENWIPLNKPAEERLIAYISSLPRGKGTPLHEYIIEAAAKVLPTLSGMEDTATNRAMINQKIMEVAHVLQMKATGLMPQDETPRLAVKLPQHQGNVPLMTGVRIRHDANAHNLPGPGPQRGPAKTRQRSAPVPAASKDAPAMTSVQSLPLGTEPSGVTV